MAVDFREEWKPSVAADRICTLPASVDKVCDSGESRSRCDTETRRTQKGADRKSTAFSATMMSNDGLSSSHLSGFGYAMDT